MYNRNFFLSFNTNQQPGFNYTRPYQYQLIPGQQGFSYQIPPYQMTFNVSSPVVPVPVPVPVLPVMYTASPYITYQAQPTINAHTQDLLLDEGLSVFLEDEHVNTKQAVTSAQLDNELLSQMNAVASLNYHEQVVASDDALDDFAESLTYLEENTDLFDDTATEAENLHENHDRLLDQLTLLETNAVIENDEAVFSASAENEQFFEDEFLATNLLEQLNSLQDTDISSEIQVAKAMLNELNIILNGLNFHEQLDAIKAFPKEKKSIIANAIIKQINVIAGIQKIEALTIKELLILAQVFNTNQFALKINVQYLSITSKLTALGLRWKDLSKINNVCISSMEKLNSYCADNLKYLNQPLFSFLNIIKSTRVITKNNLDKYLTDIIKAFAGNNSPVCVAQELNVQVQWLVKSYYEIIIALEKQYPDVKEFRQQLAKKINFQTLKKLCDFVSNTQEFQTVLAVTANISHEGLQTDENVVIETQESTLHPLISLENAQHIAQEPLELQPSEEILAEFTRTLESLSFDQQINAFNRISRQQLTIMADVIIHKLNLNSGLQRIEELTIKELLILAKVFYSKLFAAKIRADAKGVESKLTVIGLTWKDLSESNAKCIAVLKKFDTHCINNSDIHYLNQSVLYYSKLQECIRKITKDNLDQYLPEIIKEVLENDTATRASQALNIQVRWLVDNSNAILLALEKKYPSVREFKKQVGELRGFKKLQLICTHVYESQEFRDHLTSISVIDNVSQMSKNRDEETLLSQAILPQSQLNTDSTQLPDFSDADFDASLYHLIGGSEYLDDGEHHIEEAIISPVEFHSSDEMRIYDPRMFASHASPKRGLLEAENISPTKKVRQEDRFNFN